MATTVNKQSLREEFDTLKTRFDQQCADGAMTADNRALCQALLALLEVLMAVFMEKRTPKTSKNSGVPPSQTEKADDTASDPPGGRGKGKPVDGQRWANTRTIETVEIAAADACTCCGADLGDTPCQGHERRTRIDIVFEKVVTHIDAEIKHCPACQKATHGAFPDDLAGPLQYGLGVKAYLLNLLIAQMLSVKRVQLSLQTLIGQAIAEASILKYVLQLHRVLEQWEADATQQLLNMPAIHVDETSFRVDGTNHWIHVCSAGEITVKFLHRRRGQKAMEAIGVLPRYSGAMIHDCWASYFVYRDCDHGLCGAHLLRELTFVVDTNGYTWARDMKRLLKDTRARVAGRKRKKLNRREYAKLVRDYRNIIADGEAEMPPIPPKQNGKRGCVAKPYAYNLWARLQANEAAVLLFARQAEVAFTNNRAERDLRMSKVKQKISGCFRKREYAEAYCRISSYLQTMANKGYNPLVAIQMALSGELYGEGRE